MKQQNLVACSCTLSLLFLLGFLLSTISVTTGLYSNKSAKTHIVAKSVSVGLSWGEDDLQNNRALAFNASGLTRRDQDYSCSATKACSNGACCGSYQGTDAGVCGYGPSYCGSDCTSNCDAKAECLYTPPEYRQIPSTLKSSASDQRLEKQADNMRTRLTSIAPLTSAARSLASVAPRQHTVMPPVRTIASRILLCPLEQIQAAF